MVGFLPPVQHKEVMLTQCMPCPRGLQLVLLAVFYYWQAPQARHTTMLSNVTYPTLSDWGAGGSVHPESPGPRSRLGVPTAEDVGTSVPSRAERNTFIPTGALTG